MIVKKVTRSYSRSLNTKNYGLPESWIKIESTFEAECESGDDAVKVSALLAEQAQNDVIQGIQTIIDKINANKAAQTTPPTPPTTTTPPSSTGAFVPPANEVTTPRQL